MVDSEAACPRPDRFIVWKDRLRNPIHTTLYGSNANGNPEHRLAEIFDSPSATALASAELTHEPGKPWPISDLETFWNYTLTRASARCAVSRIENEMGNLHLNFGKLDMLMSMERSQTSEFLTPAPTWFGCYGDCLGRLKKRLLASLVPLFGSGLAFPFRFLSFCSLLRWVRRRRAVRVLRVLPNPCLQFFNAIDQLPNDFMLSQNQGPHRRWRLFPIFVRNCKALCGIGLGRTGRHVAADPLALFTAFHLPIAKEPPDVQQKLCDYATP